MRSPEEGGAVHTSMSRRPFRFNDRGETKRAHAVAWSMFIFV